MTFILQAETVLQWEKLTYKVATMVNKSAAYRVILNEINGEVRAGETIAIIGASGAGKTTLLTIEETLDYVSKLHLPNSLHTAKDKRDRVAKIIKQLRLESVRKSQIGDMKVCGVSSGERKRVSIGTELLPNPSLIFLDEPTSGLDSNSSQLVVELVKQIVNERRTAALITIHQPSARIFNLFDKAILLSQGHLVYFADLSLDSCSEDTLAESKMRVASLVYSFMHYKSRYTRDERVIYKYLCNQDVATE
ncbi:hypothetical protein LPJ66_007881 [Kickxella alabastrina]|uniref:Uncharacterized protein n=1 Tax=Kickxella alabastrina TaxID=61397 RepID=A0ACC1I7V1_9FUNG|nr:hypothetical protein LPJ66_007881 [Kickxella alabastrina]